MFDELQRRWIFQPGRSNWWAGEAATAGMHDVWLDFDSLIEGNRVRLHGVWLPHASRAAPQLLYLHGAWMNVRGSATRIRRMHELGFSVLAIDYRGFGQSTDTLPSEALALEDARAAWNWLRGQDASARRLIFGHSLGGAIAVQLAADLDDAAGLMVEGTFTSMSDVIRSFRWGWLPVGSLLTQRLDAGAHVGRIRAPVLVAHGSEDRLVAPALGRALYDRVRAPKRFELIEGGTHHNANALGRAQYARAVAELFDMR